MVMNFYRIKGLPPEWTSITGIEILCIEEHVPHEEYSYYSICHIINSDGVAWRRMPIAYRQLVDGEIHVPLSDDGYLILREMPEEEVFLAKIKGDIPCTI